MKWVFEQRVGKTICSVNISQFNAGSPRLRLFLIFDDDTSFEVFGEEFQGANAVDAGGEDRVIEYAGKFCGTIRKR